MLEWSAAREVCDNFELFVRHLPEESRCAIHTVKAHDCNFSAIPSSALKLLSCLQSLDFSSNPRIKRFPIDVLQVSSLRVLRMANCSVRVLPRNLGKMLPNLEELDLQQNELRRVPTSICDLQHLTTLVLTGKSF